VPSARTPVSNFCVIFLGLNEDKDKDSPTQVDHKDVKFVIRDVQENSKDLEKAESVGYND
jgi:hypothetical protein